MNTGSPQNNRHLNFACKVFSASQRVGYDPLGRWTCLAECTGDTTNSVRYFKWEGLRLAEEQNASGTVIRRYFPGGFWFNNANYFYLTDHLGSVRQVTDASGNVVARFEYDPYGRRTQTYGSLQVDIGFTGHFHHGPSGLVLAPLRLYDPETGRWIRRDPIQEDGGLNLYAYCSGDPVNAIDPSGLDVFLLFWDTTQGNSGSGHVGIAVGTVDALTFYEANPVNGAYSPIKVPYKVTGSLKQVLHKTDDYIVKQEIPVLILRLPTTTAEDANALKALQSWFATYKTWEPLTQNCSGAAQAGLQGTGRYKIPFKRENTPFSLAQDVMNFNPVIVSGNPAEYLKQSSVRGVLQKKILNPIKSIKLPF